MQTHWLCLPCTQQWLWLPIDSHSVCAFVSDFIIQINFGIVAITILLRIEQTTPLLCVCCRLCHQISGIKVEKFESFIVVPTPPSVSNIPRLCALTPFKANRAKRLNLPPHYHLFNKYTTFIGIESRTCAHIKGAFLVKGKDEQFERNRRINQNRINSLKISSQLVWNGQLLSKTRLSYHHKTPCALGGT